MSAADILSHAAAAACVLVVAFGLFACGWIGGGDAKLAAATVLWIGFAHLADYLLYASLLGGALTLLLIQFRALPLPRMLVGRQWAERLHRRGGGVPYGIALAAAALVDLSADRVDDGDRPLALSAAGAVAQRNINAI